jgi:hypothetical protein
MVSALSFSPPETAGYQYTMICSTVHIAASGISQEEGGRMVVAVPKEDIREVRLDHDSRSRHPFLQFFAGFILIATGSVFLIAAFLIAEGGIYRVQIQSLTFGVPLVPLGLWLMVGIGLWLVIGVFRGRYTLLIDTESGKRKIYFEESAKITDILPFIKRANQELGYQIDLSIMDTMLVEEGAGIPSHRR